MGSMETRTENFLKADDFGLYREGLSFMEFTHLIHKEIHTSKYFFLNTVESNDLKQNTNFIFITISENNYFSNNI
jgi:hypothetical protein